LIKKDEMKPAAREPVGWKWTDLDQQAFTELIARKIWRVDNKVGNVRNTGPGLILPLEDPLL
jgi:hypothetical protein